MVFGIFFVFHLLKFSVNLYFSINMIEIIHEVNFLQYCSFLHFFVMYTKTEIKSENLSRFRFDCVGNEF